MSNVRFYRLEVLPNFDTNKKGIFVHVTEAMQKADWVTTGGTTVRPSQLQMGNGKVLVEWLTEKNIESIASGLWFGGENGWELLTNDTSSGAITAAIEALDVEGYAQATITTNTPAEGEPNSSTLTIKGIKEVDGKIGIPTDNESQDFDIAIDGVYNETDNKIATQSTVNNKIATLDANAFQTVTKSTNGVNTVLTFNGIKEVDGIISQGVTEKPETFTVGDAKLKIQIGSDEAGALEVFSANAESDGAIKLNGDVFKKDGDVISVITKNNDVSSTNPLVTQNDINGLAGAMHYRGGVTSVPTADNSTKKGDVWIVTTPFGGYEAGDMFIARADGASATFDEVQGNLTLGIGDGQIAKNDGNLINDEIVIASGNGIKTSGFKLDNASSRVIGVSDLAESESVHGTKVSDTLTVFGQNRNASLTINSNNESIEITGSNTDNDATITVDLVWNTTIE